MLNILESLGLFVCLGGFLSVLVAGVTEIIDELKFAKREISTQAGTVVVMPNLPHIKRT